MDFDKERDFADQGLIPDVDMEEDTEILKTLLKHMPSCIAAADIEQQVRDILHPCLCPCPCLCLYSPARAIVLPFSFKILNKVRFMEICTKL